MGCKWKVTWEVLPAYAALQEGGGWRGRNLNTGCCDSYLEQETQRALVPSCSNHRAPQPRAFKGPSLPGTSWEELCSPEPFLSSSGTSPRGRNGQVTSDIYKKRSFFTLSLQISLNKSQGNWVSISSRVWIPCLLISFEVATKWALRCLIATVVSPETLPSPLQKRPL